MSKKKREMDIGIHKDKRTGAYTVHWGTTDRSYFRNKKIFRKLKSAIRFKNSLIKKYKKKGYKVHYTAFYRW